MANQKELVDLGGVPILIRSLSSATESEELNQAIRYVLQACTSTGKICVSFGKCKSRCSTVAGRVIYSTLKCNIVTFSNFENAL